MVLASRSFYFEASLSHDFKEKEQKVVNFTDVNYDSFMTLLRHIYSDTLKIDTKQIYELLSVNYCFSCLYSWLIVLMSFLSRKSASTS